MCHLDFGSIFSYNFLVEDQERNNGFDKPYYMSKKLQKLMGVYNRVKEGTDGSPDPQDTTRF